MNLKSYYQNKLNQAIHKNESIQKRILQISLLRIAIFILGFIAICYGYNLGGTIIGGIVLATLIPSFFWSNYTTVCIIRRIGMKQASVIIKRNLHR